MEEYLTVSDLSDRIKYSKFLQYSLQRNICAWKALTMFGIRRLCSVLASKDTSVNIIKHDYEITVRLKNIKDNINYTLKHNLANKVIIVVDDIDIERFRTRTARKQESYGYALEFKPISECYNTKIKLICHYLLFKM